MTYRKPPDDELEHAWSAWMAEHAVLIIGVLILGVPDVQLASFQTGWQMGYLEGHRDGFGEAY